MGFEGRVHNGSGLILQAESKRVNQNRVISIFVYSIAPNSQTSISSVVSA